MQLSKNEEKIIMLLRDLPPYGKVEITPDREARQKGFSDKYKVITTTSKILE